MKEALVNINEQSQSEFDTITSPGRKHLVEPSMKNKQEVVDMSEIKLLFYSKLIDMNLKYSDDQLQRFIRYITKHSYSGKLKLMNLGLGLEGAKTIDAILRKNNKIKKLYLNSNKLGDEGAQILAKSLS